MFEVQSYSYLKKIYPFEWVMLVIYLAVIILIALFTQIRNINREPLYRFYTKAVIAKLLSSVAFCCVYIYYYQGGDTVSYFETTRAMVNLGLQHPDSLITVMTSHASNENYYLFNGTTGFPWPYMYYDSNTFFVTKLMVPLVMLAFRSYLLSSVLLSFVSFLGVWKLFLLINRMYPGLERRLAFGVLFVPSVLFWGSGILKDTITFSAVCWFIYTFYWTFIGKKKRLVRSAIFLLSAYVLMMVKPYVLIALLPGSFVWLLHTRIVKLRARFLRITIIPLIYVFSFLVGYAILSLAGSRLGKFSVEKMFKTAVITQNDLKQDYYHGSSFDIGSFEPTVSGVLSKAPAAMNVGLFRPFIWEARNVVMLISGLENLIYLILALMIFWRLLGSPGRFFKMLFDQPFLLFLFSYSLLFSVLVGLSTSNFGALVRFKIPFLSCFVVMLLLMEFYMRKEKKGYASMANVPSLKRIA